MKKIVIVIANNIERCPYILPYIQLFQENSIDFDVIYMDRDKKKNNNGFSSYPIKWLGLNKFINYSYYSFKVQRILKQQKYNMIFSFTTVSSVFLSYSLLGEYKKKYVLDIRDYTNEKNRVFYAIEKKLIKSSKLTVISSPEFKSFLPKSEYLLCHNLNEKILKEGMTCNYSKKKQITVGYIGTIAYKEQCKKFIDLVAADRRFNFFLYGNEQGEKTVEEYVRKTKCERIRYFGPYLPDYKLEIIKKIDILFNAYGNGNPMLNTALSNKLYDSIFTMTPLLTSPGTAMEKEAGPLAYSIDFNMINGLDGLYEWYQNIDITDCIDYAKKYIKVIEREHLFFKKKISEVLLHD